MELLDHCLPIWTSITTKYIQSLLIYNAILQHREMLIAIQQHSVQDFPATMKEDTLKGSWTPLWKKSAKAFEQRQQGIIELKIK